MPSWRHSLAACVLIADSAQGFATFPQTSTFARLRGGTLAWKGNALSAMNGRKTLRQHVWTSWRCQLPPQEEDAGTGVAPASSETLLGMTKLNGGESGGSVGAQIERTLLKAVTASGVFMFLWVFVLFPGSAYTGFAEHDKFIEWLFAQDGPIQIPVFRIVAPVSLITKYNELGHLPAFTHAVPGAIWSLLAPLQLLPEARARLGASWHSVAGRTMLTAAAVLMVGYGIIDANDLYSDTHDFQGHGGGLAAWVDSLKLLPLPMNLLGVRFLAAYFVASGLVCVVSLRACVGDVPLWQVRRACGSVHLSLSLCMCLYQCMRLCVLLYREVCMSVCVRVRESVWYVCVCVCRTSGPSPLGESTLTGSHMHQVSPQATSRKPNNTLHTGAGQSGTSAQGYGCRHNDHFMLCCGWRRCSHTQNSQPLCRARAPSLPSSSLPVRYLSMPRVP